QEELGKTSVGLVDLHFADQRFVVEKHGCEASWARDRRRPPGKGGRRNGTLEGGVRGRCKGARTRAEVSMMRRGEGSVKTNRVSRRLRRRCRAAPGPRPGRPSDAAL